MTRRARQTLRSLALAAAIALVAVVAVMAIGATALVGSTGGSPTPTSRSDHGAVATHATAGPAIPRASSPWRPVATVGSVVVIVAFGGFVVRIGALAPPCVGGGTAEDLGARGPPVVA
jgi:amino acid transporter